MIENYLPQSTPANASGISNDGKSAGSSPLMVKRARILAAWAQLAPEARFGNMSLPQFIAATGPSEEMRNLLAQTRARISGMLGERMVLEESLNTLLKRVANAVRCDPNHGDNSQLYRAMGFVPSSERKSPPAAGEPAQPRKQIFVSVWARCQLMLAAWEQAGGQPLPGVAIEELRAAATAYEQKRALIRQEQARRAGDVGLKKAGDKATAALIRRVAAGVISSDVYGIDSPLYRAMGYIPGNERKRPGRKASLKVPAQEFAERTPVTVPGGPLWRPACGRLGGRLHCGQDGWTDPTPTQRQLQCSQPPTGHRPASTTNAEQPWIPPRPSRREGPTGKTNCKIGQ